MAEYNKKLYYRKGNETKSIKLYTTTTEAGDERFAVRDGNNTVYAKVGDEDDSRASDVRVLVRGGYGPTYAIYTTAGPREAETLTHGNMNEGYFGTISSGAMNYIEPWKLLDAVWEVGASDKASLESQWGSKGNGTLQNLDTPWLKFAYEDKVLITPMKSILRDISWDRLNAKGAVFGKTMNIGGVNYKCRLMTGGTHKDDTTSEWNKLMYKIAATSAQGTAEWAAFTASELGLLYSSGQFTWCQELVYTGTDRVLRGYDGDVSFFSNNRPNHTGDYMGFRPVLELIP